MKKKTRGEKAEKNFAAAEVLRQQGYYDSCASRAYYGVYLMAWEGLTQFGIKPNSNQNYFRHDRLAETLSENGLIGPDDIDRLKLLYSWRILADYRPDPLELDHATASLEIARGLMDTLLEAKES